MRKSKTWPMFWLSLISPSRSMCDLWDNPWPIMCVRHPAQVTAEVGSNLDLAYQRIMTTDQESS